jgi:hypothetical protein
MITTALIFLLVVTIAGLVAIERAVKNARPAYEDETGFHFETETPEMAVVPVRVPIELRPSRKIRHMPIGGESVGEHALTHTGS